MQKANTKIFSIVHEEKNNKASLIFNFFILAMILLSFVTSIAETFQLPANIKIALNYFEVFSTVIFTIEYVLRVYSSNCLYPNISPAAARIKYVFTFMAIIDLIAIVPFYIPFLISVNLSSLRMLRLFRLFRLFKVNRYTNAFANIGKVFSKKKSELVSSVGVVLFLMIVSSVIMYNFEHEAQPEVFTNAFSSLWWAFATLTTIGYGDIFPVTAVGKILSAVIAMLGIGLVAVPTGIISAGFVEQINETHVEEKQEKAYCPYCGKKLDE